MYIVWKKTVVYLYLINGIPRKLCYNEVVPLLRTWLFVFRDFWVLLPSNLLIYNYNQNKRKMLCGIMCFNLDRSLLLYDFNFFFLIISLF